MPLTHSVLMTFVVSAIATLKSLGPTPAFIATWPAAWAISWLVAFPTLLAVLPLVRRIVALVVEAPGRTKSGRRGCWHAARFRPHAPM
ncbi:MULTISPECIES: DUF2798 domain-containing protein [unclassified Bradyrhizobium]|uniref:DUF2798 domain-containing protein n=1 Tax=unclassified Bradyrhizobium TaxID=2631580 RepID=UPI0028E76156|nr:MULTISPECIES: DUF2798 domain-containing protein [unclassified Bradyrhizobium]